MQGNMRNGYEIVGSRTSRRYHFRETDVMRITLDSTGRMARVCILFDCFGIRTHANLLKHQLQMQNYFTELHTFYRGRGFQEFISL